MMTKTTMVTINLSILDFKCGLAGACGSDCATINLSILDFKYFSYSHLLSSRSL